MLKFLKRQLDKFLLTWVYNEYARARYYAKMYGLEDKFDDAFILGNEGMKSVAGLEYRPMEIIMTLFKHEDY